MGNIKTTLLYIIALLTTLNYMLVVQTLPKNYLTLMNFGDDNCDYQQIRNGNAKIISKSFVDKRNSYK